MGRMWHASTLNRPTDHPPPPTAPQHPHPACQRASRTATCTHMASALSSSRQAGPCSTSGRAPLESSCHHLGPFKLSSSSQKQCSKHIGALALTARQQQGSGQGSRGPSDLPSAQRLIKTRAASDSASGSKDEGSGVYPLEQTKTLVETAMLAAVSGLAYLLSTILKLDSSLGYFLPLPVVLAAMRGGVAAGWRTMSATGFLLVVLLGPLRAVSYLLIHGLLAASLASMWKLKSNFWLSILVGAAVRMAGQIVYLLLSSVTMNENLFAIMMSNVYAMLDQMSASIGAHGSPSSLAINCMLFSLLSVNSLCYVFLLTVVYRVILTSMGFQLGPLPGIIRKYLYAGMPDPDEAQKRYG